MLGKNTFHKLVTLMTVACVWSVYSMVAFAVPMDQSGDITITGQVTVNGQAAVSNSTVMSGAVIAAGANSNAIVSLGKLGRVEVLADSNVTLVFSSSSIVATLSAGQTRLSTSAGTAATVTTKDATVIADSSQADNFLVQVECSHTHVDTTSGLVTCGQDRPINRSWREQVQLRATSFRRAAHHACVRIPFPDQRPQDCRGCFYLLPAELRSLFSLRLKTMTRPSAA